MGSFRSSPQPRYALLALLTPCALLASLAGLVGCALDPEDADLRPRVVTHLATEVVVPAFRQLAADTSVLPAAAEDVCSLAPSESRLQEIERLRGLVRASHRSWSRSRLIDFGPLDQRRSTSLIDWQPFDSKRLAQLLAERSAEEIDSQAVRERWPSGARGLSALAWLLAEPQERLPGVDSPGCAMLIAASAVIANEAAALEQEWGSGSGRGEAYVGRLTGVATVSFDPRESVNRLVRALVFALEGRLDGERLVATMDMPAEAALFDLSLAGMASEVSALRDLYLGTHAGPDPGHGLTRLVRDLSPESDQRLRAALDGALAAARQLEQAHDAESHEVSARLAAFYRQLEEVQRLMVTDVTSLLGVSIGFSDNDGDTG